MRIAIGIWLALAAFIQASTLDFKEIFQTIDAPADVTTVTANYEFTNKSNTAVTIQKLDPGCSCVAAEITDGKIRYEPGESGSISAKFDMTNFSGSVDKAILLYLDKDPMDKPSQILKLKVNIPVLVGVEPKTLKWEIGGKPAPQTIKIRIIDGQTIHVTDIQSSSDAFSYQLKTLEDGRSYDLVITPKDMKSPSIGVFRIETDCKIQKHRIQQAFGVVRRPTPSEAAAKK